jgi:hypothetical protein
MVGHGSDNMKCGDYKLEAVTLSSLISTQTADLSGLCKQIEIFEDMFSPCLTAKLHIEDSYNLPELFPITGQEKVTIIFKADIDSIEPTRLVFRVYKLDEQDILRNGRSQSYVLHLISEGGYLNYSQQCGYAVSGHTSTMVSTILMKHFPESVWKSKLQIEISSDNYSFVLPKNYTPFKAITWLASKAMASVGDGYSPYFFYETFDGYCFKSLSNIIEEGSREVIPYFNTEPNFPFGMDRFPSPYDTNLPSDFHRVQKLTEHSRFDMAENIMQGTISSTLEVHDILRKEKRKTTLRELDVFSKKRKLGAGMMFRTGDPETKRVMDGALYYEPSTPYTAYNDRNNITDNTQVENILLRRNYHLNTMLTQKIDIDIFGDNRKRVGQVIDLIVPNISVDGLLAEGQIDKNLSGKFLITSIKHTLGRGYICKLELSRNCMGVE